VAFPFTARLTWRSSSSTSTDPQLDQHRDSYRGYVGMLVVDKPYRKLKLGSELVSRALAAGPLTTSLSTKHRPQYQMGTTE